MTAELTNPDKWRTTRWIGLLSIIVKLLTLAQARAEGTWVPLVNPAPDLCGTMLLLSDGSVIVQDSRNYPTDIWFKLTPDSQGHYVNGTWSFIQPSLNVRAACASQVLQDGRVFVAGGEYGANNTADSTAEIYNPLSNKWSSVNPPTSLLNTNGPSACTSGLHQAFSDMISETLPNGSVLMSPVEPMTNGGTLIFNPIGDVWSFAGTLANGACHMWECSWVKLADGSILAIDSQATTSERYIPSLNNGQGGWVSDKNVPVDLFDSYVNNGAGEEGAGFLLPDNNAFFLGSLPYTAIYIPSPSGGTNQGNWVAGPSLTFSNVMGPTIYQNCSGNTVSTPNPISMGAPDGPAAMMINGKILCALSIAPSASNPCKLPPTYFFEYDYANTNAANPYGTFTQIHAPGGSGSSYTVCGTTDGTIMLQLPDGNILFNGNCSGVDQSNLFVYAPDGSPLSAGKPTITSVTVNSDGSLHLTGTGFNGISEGAAFGDDAQMATAYPIVSFTDNSSGKVYYGRTYNWSTSAVQTGTNIVTTEVALPSAVFSGPGMFSLRVIANGNPSNPYPFYGYVWVDFNYTGSIQNGSYSFPYKTLAQGVAAVSTGGTIAINSSVQPSTSPETMTISRAMTIISVSGPATVGL